MTILFVLPMIRLWAVFSTIVMEFAYTADGSAFGLKFIVPVFFNGIISIIGSIYSVTKGERTDLYVTELINVFGAITMLVVAVMNYA